MTTSINGILLIEQFEGFKPKMYKDAVGLPTIGFGTLIDTESEKYLLTTTISRQKAEELLRNDLKPIERALGIMITKSINQNQYDSLVSFCYNLGINSLRTSTLLRKINIDPTDSSISQEFEKWTHGDGKILPGLSVRRRAESALYFKKL